MYSNGMHELPASFAELISLWPTAADLAADLGEKYQTVAAWKQRNSIPPDRWGRVIAAAEKRGFINIDWEFLGRLAGSNGPALGPKKGDQPPQLTRLQKDLSASKERSYRSLKR